MSNPSSPSSFSRYKVKKVGASDQTTLQFCNDESFCDQEVDYQVALEDEGDANGWFSNNAKVGAKKIYYTDTVVNNPCATSDMITTEADCKKAAADQGFIWKEKWNWKHVQDGCSMNPFNMKGYFNTNSRADRGLALATANHKSLCGEDVYNIPKATSTMSEPGSKSLIPGRAKAQPTTLQTGTSRPHRFAPRSPRPLPSSLPRM